MRSKLVLVLGVLSVLFFPKIVLGLNSEYLYWTTGRDIKRAFLDGSNVETVVSIGNLGPRGLAFDFGTEMMYWTNMKSIQRSSLDGTAIEELVPYTAGSRYSGLALDVQGGKMYWTDVSQGCISRANLDGSATEDIITGLSRSSSIRPLLT